MTWLIYIILSLSVIALIVGIIYALRTRVEFARQISDAGTSVFKEIRDWFRKIFFLDLKKSMRAGLSALKQQSTTKNYRYDKPWYLIMGDAASGKTSFLQTLIGAPSVEAFDTHHVNWGIFDNGVLLDVNSNYLLPQNQQRKRWSFATRAHRTFVRQLHIRRERRPLDGIIVTVSVHEILNYAANPEFQQERVNTLRDSLLSTAQRLGMNVPVYLVITQCDTLPNMTAYYNALPVERRSDILGWSSPYSPDIQFSRDWIENGFDFLCQRVAALQTDIINNTQNRDDVYDAYATVKSLAKPTTEWIASLFSSQGTTQSLMMRGFYLTGQHVEHIEHTGTVQEEYIYSPFDSPLYPKQTQSGKRITGMFADSLLNDKILREQGLAEPIKHHHVRRSRISMIVHIFFFTFIASACLWLAFSWGDLRRRAEKISEMMSMVRDERQTSKYEFEKTRKTFYYAEKTKQYLSFFAKLENNKLTNAALPVSWLGWLHSDLRHEIAVGLKGVVITGMKEEFIRRATMITDANVNYMPVDTITMNRLSIQQLPEYHALNKYVQSTGEFEHHAGLYNTLSMPHNNQRLAKIIGYLYGMNIENDVQDMIESDYKLMQSVDADNVQVELLAPQFGEKARQMNQSLQRKLFFENPVAGNITSFENTYTSVLQSPDADNVYDTFLAMATSLEHLQSGLQNKESEWISRDGFLLDAQTKKLLESIASSKLLGSGIRSIIENGFDTNFTAMRGNLQRARIGMRYGSDDSVHVVQVNPETKHWALTPAIENTYKSLVDWKKQPFVVKSSNNQRLATLASQMGETQRIVWNGALLKTMPQTLESYSKYLTEGINKFPAELQIPAENVVRRGIHRTIGDIIVRACDMQPTTANRTEQEITVEVQSFTDAIPNLGLALRQLSASDDGSGSACATIIGKQIAGILGSMYRWVNERQPYSVSLNESKLALWKPQQSVREVAFDIREADQLQDYLESQRKPIEEWTKQYAAPLLNFYNQNGLSSTARLTPSGENDVREWNSITRGIEGYTAKAPNNSLSKLEDFITSLGNITQTNVEEMQKMVISRNASGKDDFFLRKIKDIANDIRKSIALNSAPRFREDYKRIYQTVSDMRQYFPFGESEIDADPERIKAYFTKINNELTYAKLWLSMGGEVSLGHDRFMRELFAARDFFKPITYSGENNAGAYTVTLTYRTNQAKEQNATTVYARASSQGASGSQVDKMLVTPGDQAQFTWRPGDDFRFELHWAKDGGIVPVANTEKYDILNDRTVVFKRAGNWSLLRFVSEFMNGRSNGKIQLALPVVTSGKGTASSTDQNLLLYVDVDIAPRVRDENLTFPLLVGQAPVPE